MTDASDLQARLEAFLSRESGRATTVSGLARLPGGASRETWSFSAHDGTGERRMILRRDPPGAAATTGRAAEFELLRRCAAAGVPVPAAPWLAADPGVLGAPGFVMEFVDGETIARRILRDDAYASARPAMAAQCGEILARIHAVDVDGLPGMTRPQGEPALEELTRYTAALDSFGEPHPAFELAIRWMRRRPPRTDRVGLVHGDFRNGNFIVGPEGIRAVLDWELSHVGDPWEDLGWLCARPWRFGGAGEVGGFGSRDELYAAYEKASGVTVDVDAVRWWEVYANFKWGISTLVQTFTHLSGRVRSVELAAIGRRTCETEYDLLGLVAEAAR